MLTPTSKIFKIRITPLPHQILLQHQRPDRFFQRAFNTCSMDSILRLPIPEEPKRIFLYISPSKEDFMHSIPRGGTALTSPRAFKVGLVSIFFRYQCNARCACAQGSNCSFQDASGAIFIEGSCWGYIEAKPSLISSTLFSLCPCSVR